MENGNAFECLMKSMKWLRREGLNWRRESPFSSRESIASLLELAEERENHVAELIFYNAPHILKIILEEVLH